MDGIAPNMKVRPGTGFVSSVLWVTDETPARMDLGKDRADRTIGVPPPPNGSILRVVDFPPVTKEAESVPGPRCQKGARDNTHGRRRLQHARRRAGAAHAFMHRTKSIDYALVLEGEIDMLLDDSEVHLKAGDVLVQQGTNHAWVNRSGKDVPHGVRVDRCGVIR
jgi:mannose-6-phosphate isomerase-like protein (cupin superfamily)